jgi:hypothetical protein
MSTGFYTGIAIILVSVFSYPFIKHSFYPDKESNDPFVEQP